MSARATKLLPATPRSKQESAYQRVRTRIERGEYPPGQRLVIDQLAGELGMSQVPIREAIRRLEAEGWLTYELNSGATVAPLNRETWAQLLESVAVTEGYATALAAPHLTAPDLQELAAINKRMRSALRAGNAPAISAANRAFHARILGRCPNAIMAGQLRQSQARLDSLSRALFSREQGVLLRLLGPKLGQVAVADHEALIAALRQNADPARIERLTREHVLVHLLAAREEFDRLA